MHSDGGATSAGCSLGLSRADGDLGALGAADGPLAVCQIVGTNKKLM